MIVNTAPQNLRALTRRARTPPARWISGRGLVTILKFRSHMRDEHCCALLYIHPCRHAPFFCVADNAYDMSLHCSLFTPIHLAHHKALFCAVLWPRQWWSVSNLHDGFSPTDTPTHVVLKYWAWYCTRAGTSLYIFVLNTGLGYRPYRSSLCV